MGNVVIAGNIKRERARIDPAGNIINPRTKQIEIPVEPESMSPVVSQETPEAKPVSKMDELINKLVEKKIEEMVAKKVEEALSKL